LENKRKSITKLARELRNNPTPAEYKLWQMLRNRRCKGYKFLRQKPIIYNQKNEKAYFFIADFYCAAKRLVIELDGQYHQNQQKYDQNRDLVLEKLGLQVLRIKNHELDNMPSVMSKIADYLEG